MRTAVVGHVEWIQFATVPHVPTAGEIIHARESWEAPGGAGAVAAVQLAKLCRDAHLFTALGIDRLAEPMRRGLESQGVNVHARHGPQTTRKGFTHIDADGERTITVMGERLGPRGQDDLPWSLLADCDATYFTAGDRAALTLARSSRVLVATSRVVSILTGSGVRLDALVGSGSDPAEAYLRGALDPSPRLVVMTAGKSGGTYWLEDGRECRFESPALPGRIVDRYGAGDSFAAGLTFALGGGTPITDAIGFAARCGAAALTGRAPFGGQLESE